MRLKIKVAIAFKNAQLKAESVFGGKPFKKYKQVDLGVALFPDVTRRSATVMASKLAKNVDLKTFRPEWEATIRKETGYEGFLFED